MLDVALKMMDYVQPMKKQGSIILGIGGDNSDSAHGTFYEGVMTSGISSNATDGEILCRCSACFGGCVGTVL